jgi:hypothetical protein
MLKKTKKKWPRIAATTLFPWYDKSMLDFYSWSHCGHGKVKVKCSPLALYLLGINFYLVDGS